MKAIENVRRDLASAPWTNYSAAPFAGAVHDLAKPLRQRLESRQYAGPYYFTPAKPGTGRGFYQASHGLACDRAGSTFRLRLELANDHLSGRIALTRGYYCDLHQDSTLTPIIARLPHGRGFLAGWTMGAGMVASLDATIWESEREAAMAAHDMAERDAEREREREAASNETDSDESEA
jgi:hypothetical protein